MTNIKILWLKRLTALAAILAWTYAMYIFLKDPAPFAELAPYCMGSTMLIFGVLSGVFKGLEYWDNTLKD
jgi:peptidoglycan/LPS O-acetylase OafA/YrhL